jgi:hypothetical protein
MGFESTMRAPRPPGIGAGRVPADGAAGYARGWLICPPPPPPRAETRTKTRRANTSCKATYQGAQWLEKKGDSQSPRH